MDILAYSKYLIDTCFFYFDSIDEICWQKEES